MYQWIKEKCIEQIQMGNLEKALCYLLDLMRMVYENEEAYMTTKPQTPRYITKAKDCIDRYFDEMQKIIIEDREKKRRAAEKHEKNLKLLGLLKEKDK